ncbi:unnamed protein product [Paramecium sonneborni]|uniref:Uncharacterized protein n=1 Tax=Paramecium sonneborni TaxID=65129 RepID=A0A8S1QJ21_9CILI|nr:unnamed protein product [Paramecium sonneborni]
MLQAEHSNEQEPQAAANAQQQKKDKQKKKISDICNRHIFCTNNRLKFHNFKQELQDASEKILLIVEKKQLTSQINQQLQEQQSMYKLKKHQFYRQKRIKKVNREKSSNK